MRAYEPFATLL